MVNQIEQIYANKNEHEAHSNFVEEIRKHINDNDMQLSDESVLEIIDESVLHDKRFRGKDHREKRRIVQNIFNATRKDLDILQPLIEDRDINEVMVNGKHDIFIERKGIVERVPYIFNTTEELEEVILRIGAKVHREINEMHPVLDARLDDGSRVHAVYKNVALNGPILTIRKFPEHKIRMEALIASGTIQADAAIWLEKFVIAGYNIFISGGTSSGKTTFLNVLADYIPGDERVIVIEDSAELQIDSIQNIVRLETKNANVQGKGEITMKDLIKASLRMRPDRIVVGEVRGSEAVDMIQAMNTGHDGSLSSGHANSPRGMLSRLETMFLMSAPLPLEAIRGQLASAIDIMVHLGRFKDKSRKVLEISELLGYENGELLLNPLFKFNPLARKECGSGVLGCLERTGNRLQNTEKFSLRGIGIP